MPVSKNGRYCQQLFYSFLSVVNVSFSTVELIRRKDNGRYLTTTNPKKNYFLQCHKQLINKHTVSFLPNHNQYFQLRNGT